MWDDGGGRISKEQLKLAKVGEELMKNAVELYDRKKVIELWDRLENWTFGAP